MWDFYHHMKVARCLVSPVATSHHHTKWRFVSDRGIYKNTSWHMALPVPAGICDVLFLLALTTRHAQVNAQVNAQLNTRNKGPIY